MAGLLFGETNFLEGALVEISGVGCEVEPYFVNVALPPVNVDGECGRCVVWSDEFGRYIVHLFSGPYVLIEKECLRRWAPPAPESGGFDLAWPSAPPGEACAPEEFVQMSVDMLEILEQKGWCVVQLAADEVTRSAALEQARALPDLACPKTELAADFLGIGGTGKTSVIEPGAAGEDEEAIWALSDFDQVLTLLARSLAPHTGERLGFKSRGRRKGVVSVPFSDAAEERRARPESLSEEDIEAGELDAHLEFVRGCRLCLTAWMDAEGGEFVLHPRKDQMPGAGPVRLPLVGGRLLVYRCDVVESFSCTPSSRHAATLTTWILDDELDKQRLSGGHFAGDDLERAEALGILTGPPMPLGHRTHVMAAHCRMPGNVSNTDHFLKLFSCGCDGYHRMPFERWDVGTFCTEPGEPVNPFKSYVTHAAMIDTKELTYFDNDFFGIVEEEAHFVAPGQRLVLQDGYMTLSKAGFTKQSLRGRNMGVYCGDTGSEYQHWDQLKPPTKDVEKALGDRPFGKCEASCYAAPGVMSQITASRLSHCLGMSGGCQSIDTACSASLVGVAVAVQNFRKPEGEQPAACIDKHHQDALCVGISVLLTPMAFVALCGPSMLSPKGRCLTFDTGANGYARGDGFCGGYFKPSSSEEDNSAQLACLTGCAVNQDGRSATLTAPNGMAQQAVIRSSLREAQVVASQITIGECHGTGTALGDPIEVGAYRGVMEPRDLPVLATSAKSNIGHLECAAGLTGLLKCVIMVTSSCSAPNCHLSNLNPQLDVEGFPVYFETEEVDTGLFSNYAGVSSFGFSGTNARADVWGKCMRGAHTAVPLKPEKLQVHVQCPVTLGLMDLLTGENVVPSMPRARKADVLRDVGAPYDISRRAYHGNFRYRPDDEEDELDPFVTVCVYGSWTAFRSMEEMVRTDDGWHVARLTLGDTRCEFFRLCLNERRDLELYPTVDHATQHIWVEGPDAQAAGRSWCIDGRDREVKAGTVYEVRFRWKPSGHIVEWAPCGLSTPAAPARAPEFRHSYALVGTFNSDVPVEMASDGQGGWQGFFTIGATASEEFQIVRDNDWRQVIYPAQPQTVRTGVPVRGPDHLHGGKRWLVLGRPTEVLAVRLRLRDGHVAVEVSRSLPDAAEVREPDFRGLKRWESEEGWARHEYSVLGSWTDDVPIPMVFDADEEVYRGFGKVGSYSLSGAVVEAFQVVVDGDLSQAIYPLVDGAGSGESIALGPGGDSSGRTWTVASETPHARFEICYDPHQADSRKVVTWRWMAPAESRRPRRSSLELIMDQVD